MLRLSYKMPPPTVALETTAVVMHPVRQRLSAASRNRIFITDLEDFIRFETTYDQ